MARIVDAGRGILAPAAARAEVPVEGESHLGAEARGEAEGVLCVEAPACLLFLVGVVEVCVSRMVVGLRGVYVYIYIYGRTLAEVDLAEVGVRVGLVEVGHGRDDAHAQDLHGRHVLEGDAWVGWIGWCI